MKTMIQSYTFNHLTKTITINDVTSIKLEDVLLITNVTSNLIIYNFADTLSGGLVINGNQLVLDYDTSLMSDSDSLQIYIDVSLPENVNELYPLTEQYTFDTNMNTVLGSQPLTDNGKIKTQTSLMKLGETKGRIGSSNEEITIDCDGSQTVALQISGIWSGTITFECRVNDGDYVGIIGIGTASTSYVSSTTSNGAWQFNTAGLKRFKLRFSTYTSGAAIVQMTATAALSRLSNADAIFGSQGQLVSQKAGSFELNTYDTNLLAVLGNSKLWRDGFYTTDFPIAPTINPTQPTTYTDNKFAKYPQILPRLRVESAGDQKLPFAQEPNTNKLMVSTDVERRLLEELLIQMQLLNQNFALANGLNLPIGQNEIK